VAVGVLQMNAAQILESVKNESSISCVTGGTSYSRMLSDDFRGTLVSYLSQ